MAATDTIEIAPDGDVTLLCGEQVGNKEIIGLRVSSHILSYGSPVFKSLLAPRFREGTTLATTSSVEIPLPEDPPGHMAMLCNILHMRHDQEPHTVNSPTMLAAFAILCDKYDCALAVKPTLEQYITNQLHKADVVVLAHYLATAAMLRYANVIKRIAVYLVLRATEPINKIVRRALGNHCHDYGVALLCTKMDCTLLQARQTIRDFVESVVEHQMDLDQSWGCTVDCEAVSKRIISYLSQLRAYRLWGEAMGHESLEGMLVKMENIRLQDPAGLKSCGRSNCSKARSDAALGSSQLMQRFGENAKEVRKAIDNMDTAAVPAASS
ncbi:hypothetical protein LTR27_004446 [Elasticomyces elasticus]|nr:hypothetical protein LTR27_004446 [Elasticomyces elasticus]